MANLIDRLQKIKAADPEDYHYRLEYLVYHLSEAHDHDQVHDLFANQDWMQARLEDGSSFYEGYQADLLMAWQKCACVQATEQINRGESPSAIALCFRYALICTSINSLAGNLEIELVIRAIQCGLWNVDRALRIARLVPDARRRCSFFAQLLKLGLEDPQQRDDAQVQGVNAAVSIQNKIERERAFVEIAPYLEGEPLRKVLEEVSAKDSQWIRAKILENVIPHLEGELFLQTLKDALSSLHEMNL